MITGVKQRAVVGKDGKIEILPTELPEGTVVEVFVLVESPQPTETDYLLSTAANRTKLRQALERVAAPENLVVITPEEWHEKYHV
jgi:antitoxin YefM